MAHTQVSPSTTSHEISRSYPTPRSRTSSQTRPETHLSPTSSSAAKASSLRSSRSSLASSHSHHPPRPISSHPTPSSSSSSLSASTSSSTSAPPVPHRHTSLPTTSTHSNSSAGRHHFHQNVSGDRMDRKDQRRGAFNQDRHGLSDAQEGGGSSAPPIHRQIKKEITANNAAKHVAILGTGVSTAANGVVPHGSTSNSTGARARAASGERSGQALAGGGSAAAQNPAPRTRTASEGRGSAMSSGKDTHIKVVGDKNVKAPGAPPPTTATRAVAPQPHPYQSSQSDLPTTIHRDENAPVASGSTALRLPTATRPNKATPAVPAHQSLSSIQRKPPPPMSEPPLTGPASPPSSSSSPGLASSSVTSPPAPIASSTGASISATASRRPSLASPLPPSPIVPISFPRHRAPPAPLNLGPAAMSSSPQASSSSNPATSPPRTRIGSADAYQNQLTPTGHHHHQSQSAGSGSWAPSPSQYAARPSSSGHVRPGSSGGSIAHPDSPSASAMMRRLLSKPAPVMSPFSSGASGSESESRGQGHRVGRGASVSRTSGSESEGVGMAIGRRAGYSSSQLGRAATASAVMSSGSGPAVRASVSSLTHSALRRKGSAGSVGSGGKGKKNKRMAFTDDERNTKSDFDFEFSDVDAGITSLGVDSRRKETYARIDERSSRISARDAKDSQDKGKEKEKEKKTRNVLRRRPSAPGNMSSGPSSSSSSLPSKASQAPVVVPPLPKSPPPPSPEARLPAIVPFSPLTLSPAITPPESRSPDPGSAFFSSAAGRLQPHAQSRPDLSQSRTSSSSKSMQRSTSASAAPPSPRHIPHLRASSQSQHVRHGAPSPSPRRSAFMSMDASAPVALSPSSNVAVSVSPRRSAFVMNPNSSGDPTKRADALCAPSGCAPTPMKVPSSPARFAKEPVSARAGTTPAASLIEAYKRQEAEKEAEVDELRWAQARQEILEKEQTMRERELRAVERQRAMMMEERERAERGRRYSEDAHPNVSAGRPVTAQGIGRSRTVAAVTHLTVQEQQEIRASLFSNHTNGSLDSLLRDRALRNRSTDALNAGSGFAAIERLAGTSADSFGRSSSRLHQLPPSALREADNFEVKPTSPAAFDGVERTLGEDPAGNDVDNDQRGSPEPYYTVFGGLGSGLGGGRGRGGGNGDVWEEVHPSQYAAYWDVPGVLQAKEFGVREVRGTPKEQARGKESLGRTLSRKVSGHWRKQGAVKDAPLGKDGGEQSRRRLLRSKSSTAALSTRHQAQVDSDSESDLGTEQAHGSRQPQPGQTQIIRTEITAESPSTPSPGGSITGGQAGGSIEKTDKAEKEKSSGGRFWKLMKRISVGGLKEKFKEDTAAPPVPALPQDYRSQTLPSAHARGGQDESSMSPPASYSTLSTPSRAIPRKAPPTSGSVPASPAMSIGVATNTASSSPMSNSDVASSKFSHSYSPRTSTSSMGTQLHVSGLLKGNDAPPLPKLNTTATRHILSQSEVALTLEQESDDAPVSGQGKSPNAIRPTISLPPHTQTFSQDWIIARTPSVELAALPLPPLRRPAANNVPASSSPLAVGLDGDNGGDDDDMPDRSESPTMPSFSTNDAVNNFKPGRRSIGSSLKSAKSRESPVTPHAMSPVLLRSRSQPASPTYAQQSFVPPFANPKVSTSPSSSSSSLVSPVSLPPPPRPMRSSQRPLPSSSTNPASLPEDAPISSHPREDSPSSWSKQDYAYASRKSESAIRDMPSALGNLRDIPTYTQQQQRDDARTHHRRSSDALSSTSTARPRRRSSAYQLSLTLGLSGHKGTTAGSIISVSTSTSAASTSPPPSALSTLTFGPVSPGISAREAEPEARRPLTEEEKAARWEDLLERSAQAGGTLHIAGGARVLASDKLKFRKK